MAEEAGPLRAPLLTHEFSIVELQGPRPPRIYKRFEWGGQETESIVHLFSRNKIESKKDGAYL